MLEDVINEDVYIISDTHLGHNNILKFENIRAKKMLEDGIKNINIETHNQWIIDNWNKEVKENDTILHLGDFSFKNPLKYSYRLNGKKYILLGNHDLDYKNKLNIGFIEVREYFIYKDILFNHYPLFENNPRNKKNKKIDKQINSLEELFVEKKLKYNIHGHNHSKINKNSLNINVSFENYFKPIKLKEIIGYI